MAAATETTTTQADFIPELYAGYAIREFNRTLLAKDLITDAADLFSEEGGLTVYIPGFMNLTTDQVDDVGETTDATYSSDNVDSEQNTLTIDKFKYVSRQITPKLDMYSRPKLPQLIGPGLGEVLARYLDITLLAALPDYSDHTAVNLRGSTVASTTDANLIKGFESALYALSSKDIPIPGDSNYSEGDLNYVVDALVHGRLKLCDKFESTDYADTKALASGILGRFMGVPVRKSNNLTTTTVSSTSIRRNMLIHKAAAAYVVSLPIKVMAKNMDFSDAHWVNAKITARLDFGYANIKCQETNTTNFKNYKLIEIQTQA